MTIVLADTDTHFLERLRKRLERITAVRVVGQSSSSTETAAMILNRNPDVAMINTILHGGGGINLLGQIRQLMVPPKIIVVTDNPLHDEKEAFVLAGADFFFDKATEDHKIVNAVRLLCRTHNRSEPHDSSFARLDE